MPVKSVDFFFSWGTWVRRSRCAVVGSSSGSSRRGRLSVQKVSKMDNYLQLDSDIQFSVNLSLTACEQSWLGNHTSNDSSNTPFSTNLVLNACELCDLEVIKNWLDWPLINFLFYFFRMRLCFCGRLVYAIRLPRFCFKFWFTYYTVWFLLWLWLEIC